MLLLLLLLLLSQSGRHQHRISSLTSRRVHGVCTATEARCMLPFLRQLHSKYIYITACLLLQTHSLLLKLRCFHSCETAAAMYMLSLQINGLCKLKKNTATVYQSAWCKAAQMHAYSAVA
jgi:hypothetical protein